MIVFESVSGFSNHSTLRNNVTDQTLLVTKHFIRIANTFYYYQMPVYRRPTSFSPHKEKRTAEPRVYIIMQTI